MAEVTHKKLSQSLPTKGWYAAAYAWLSRNAQYPRNGVEWDVRDIDAMLEAYKPLDWNGAKPKAFDHVFRRLWRWLKH